MKNFHKKPTGETLVETIVALAILAIGITASSTVIINSLRNMTNAKNRVIAVNIAREGIEAMRNIRDTNWLLYSDRRRQCWNHDANEGVCDINSLTPIEPGTYIVYKHSNQSWRLELADRNLSIDSDGDFIDDNDLDLAPLSLIDADLLVDSDGDGNLVNDRDSYNHMDADVASPFGTEARSTNFRRYITIEYLENQPNSTTSPSNITAPNDSINTPAEWGAMADETTLNRMRITSTVDWRRGGAIHSAELKTILSDHLGRSDLSS